MYSSSEATPPHFKRSTYMPIPNSEPPRIVMPKSLECGDFFKTIEYSPFFSLFSYYLMHSIFLNKPKKIKKLTNDSSLLMPSFSRA